ncbi:BSD domain-containing protein 1 [Linum perenne]
MDFFRSVFTDEPDPPPKSDPDSRPSPDQEHQQSISDSDSPPKQQSSNPNPESSGIGGGGGGWIKFGGLIKTLTTKSESVIETYRRDLKEFSTGLRKEIEVAQGSLENVGQAIDEIGSSVIKNTAEIISHGKEAILALEHDESDSSDSNVERGGGGGSSSLSSRRYSRFDAQVRIIQGENSTYCDEPEDLDDFSKWKSSEFVIEDCKEEIASLLEGNGAVDAIYRRVVPGSVDEETFWSRYYYRIYKLKQAEALRADLVKRAISAEEEDLSWDVDDDDDDEEQGELKGKANESKDDNVELKSRDSMEKKNPVEDNKSEEIVNAKEEESSVAAVATATVEEPKEEKKASTATAAATGNEANEKQDEGIKDSAAVSSKSAENSGSEGNGGNAGSCKDSDFSVVSSHQTTGEEEDLGWDEIEDLSSIDDNKKEETRVSSAANKEELRKRLSVADEEEEEELSWDIEDDDDDEPVKA